MSSDDVYDKLPLRWQYPNRRRDINYAELDAEEVAELDAKASAEGWFKTARLKVEDAQDVGWRFLTDQKRVRKGLEECRTGWLNGAGAVSAHAWHRHMEQLDVWPGSMGGLGLAFFRESGREAYSGLLYTHFVSVFECQRFVLNGVVRLRAWAEVAALDGTLAQAGLSEGLTNRLVKYLIASVGLWTRPNGWGQAIEFPNAGYVADLEEVLCFSECGVVLYPELDRFARAGKKQRDRAVVNRLRSIVNGTFGARLTAVSRQIEASRYV